MDKALSVTDVKSYSFINDSDFDVTTGSNRYNVTPQLLKHYFHTIDWVYICINLIGKECSSLIPKVYKRTLTEDKEVFEENTASPIQRLLDNPSDDFDPSLFYYSVFADLALTGNSFVYASKITKKLYYVASEIVTFRDDKYYVNNQEFDNIIHLKLPTLTSESKFGLSPLISGMPSIMFNKYSLEYLNSFYEKSATPQMFLETEVIGSRETLEQMKESFSNAYSGVTKQRKPIVLPKGVTIKPFQATIADPNFTQLLEQSATRLINLWGVPKHALSLQQAGSLGSEEHKQSLRYFWQSTIVPYLMKFSRAMTAFYSEFLEGGVIEYDLTNVPVFQDDLNKKATLAKEMLSTKTINEVRSDIWELPPVDGGDTILALSNSYQRFGNVTPSSTSDSVTPVTSVTEEPVIITSVTERLFDFTAVPRIKEQKNNYYKQIDSDDNSDFKMFIMDIFKKQLKIALRHLHTKKMKFDIDAYEKELEKMEDEFSVTYNTINQRRLSVGYNSQLQLVFDDVDRETIAALRARTAKNEFAIMAARGLKTFKYMNRTTGKIVSQIVADGAAENQSVTETANAIIDELGQRFVRRAATIARTETLTAVSIGQWGALENAEKVIPDLIKVWITADDERVRGRPDGIYPDALYSHWELNGQVRKPNKLFGERLQFPRDPNGEAGDVINCRCTMSLISKEDYDLLGV